MARLILHIKTSEKGFQNLGKCIILTYDNGGDGGLISRCMKNRSVDFPYTASRYVSDKEFKEEGNTARLKFIRYRDWNKLIADEKKILQDFGANDEWINELENLKKQYPQFNTHGQEELQLNMAE